MLGWKIALCSTLGLDGLKQTGIGSGKPMDLTYYMSDDLEIRKSNGSVFKLKGLVSKNKITLADLKAPVEEGDEITRQLPSGVTERYEVLHVQHYSGLRGSGAHVELDVRKAGSRSRSERPAQTVYNITGNNPRVNVNSTDQSVNVVNTNSEELFDKLLKSVHEQAFASELRKQLAEVVEEMRKVQGTPEYTNAYVRFMSIAADHFMHSRVHSASLLPACVSNRESDAKIQHLASGRWYAVTLSMVIPPIIALPLNTRESHPRHGSAAWPGLRGL
jgi:hypothetical protein